MSLEPSHLENRLDAVDLLDLREGPGARILTRVDLAPLLASPDTGRPLIEETGGERLRAGDEVFPIVDGIPFLLPSEALKYRGDGRIYVPAEDAHNPMSQYLFLSGVKQSTANNNLPHDDIWYRRHLARAKTMLSDASGLLLDVGCDAPDIGRALCPSGVSYVGLDPMFEDLAQFRIVGLAENLPFVAKCFDNVVFNTSLDHILDYHSAMDEAVRVLKPGGSLYLATLLWTDRARLCNDTVHFHHFRSFEIEGILRRFDIRNVKFYSWKDDTHRYGVYLRAVLR